MEGRREVGLRFLDLGKRTGVIAAVLDEIPDLEMLNENVRFVSDSSVTAE